MTMFRYHRHRGLLVALLCLLGGLPGGCAWVHWEFDHQAGLRKAVKNRQRALILFTRGFDTGANQMDREVFSDPDVQHLMRYFVPIRVDAGLNPRLVEQFGVKGTPAFVVVRPDLTVAAVQEGKMTAEQFRHFLIKNSLH